MKKLTKMSECKKLSSHTEEWNHIYPFMEWLQEQGLFLCRYETEADVKAKGEKPLKDGSYFTCPYPIPVSKTIESRLYEYFGLDPGKLEVERREILEEFRQKHKEKKQQ